jgi:cytochrome c2
MNPRFLLLLVMLILWVRSIEAESVVVGFSRFHSSAPSTSGGRLLFNELGCANCHPVSTSLPVRRGPEIQGITTRIDADWLRAFLADPESIHAGSTMPSVLSQKPEEIESVVHYLGSLKAKTEAKPKASSHVNAKRGEELFHTIGCVACHQAGKEFKPEDGFPADSERSYPSIAFPELKKKYTLANLSSFLLDPLKTRPDGRMPKIALEDTEATDIAGYLLGFESSDSKVAPTLTPFTPDPEMIKKGRDIVAKSRCFACHTLPKDVSVNLVALKKNEGGCLANPPQEGTPHYSLTEEQRSALAAFLKSPNETLSSNETTKLTLESLNCVACHERDGIGGPDVARKAYFIGDHNLGDTGRYAPPLTGVGRKLQTEWLAGVLLGENRVRPYLKTRMPIYGAATKPLAHMLAASDRKDATALPAGDDTAGRKLLGTQGGIGCITCHRWGERASLGIQALDLSNMGQRLQPEWLFEYLIDPAAYRPGTLMPSFWPGGKSSNQTILGGDTARQIASIYSFAKSANGVPEGFPEISGGEFELVPKEKPIIQRTFLKEVGTHAILVGFPTGVHLAYDGKGGRPFMLWKGKFFDAYTTWFSRFAPFEKPLSEDVARWPDPSPEQENLRFEGYKLKKNGSPIFLFSHLETLIEDQFEGVENGLAREISWSGASIHPPITHPLNVTIQEVPFAHSNQLRFIYLWK